VLASAVEVGRASAISIGAVGVRAERSSRTMVGVGLALLGAAQAVKVSRVSKIKVSQSLIFILEPIKEKAGSHVQTGR
jgi:hypothetical protein